MDNIKSKILAQYKAIDEALDKSLNKLRQLQFSNHEFNNIRQELVKALEQCVVELKSEAETNIRNVHWDKLVIAFFGETNAGKSTIIEAFRIQAHDPTRSPQSDGLIVGEGRPDFTQKAHEYELSIHGHQFLLVDVPGIEGNEAKYKDIIKEALSKAHIVFYVHALDKQPDEGTAGKIKSYLAEWSRVYTIQNVKSSVMKYADPEQRKTLLTPEVLKTERAIKIKFKNMLGNVYEGNIPIQALLAMSANASFSPTREKLVRDQRKLLKLFTPEEMLRFSQFQTLQNLVERKAEHFSDEIAKSNQQKLNGFAKRVESSIKQVTEEHSDETSRKLKFLKDFRNEANAALSNLFTDIQGSALSTLRAGYNRLSSRTKEILDTKKLGDKKAKNSWKKDQIRAMVQYFPTQMNRELNGEIKQKTDSTFNQLRLQSNKIEGVDFSEWLNFDCSFQFEMDKDILEDGLAELDINLEDAANVAEGAAALGIPGAALGPAGAIIGAGLGSAIAIAKHHFWGKKQKVASVKDSIDKMLEKSKKSSEVNVKQETSKLQQEIEQRKEQFLNQIDAEIKAVTDIQDIITSLNEGIHYIIN